jgi:hypothetical protein
MEENSLTMIFAPFFLRTEFLFASRAPILHHKTARPNAFSVQPMMSYVPFSSKLDYPLPFGLRPCTLPPTFSTFVPLAPSITSRHTFCFMANTPSTLTFARSDACATQTFMRPRHTNSAHDPHIASLSATHVNTKVTDAWT